MTLQAHSDMSVSAHPSLPPGALDVRVVCLTWMCAMYLASFARKTCEHWRHCTGAFASTVTSANSALSARSSCSSSDFRLRRRRCRCCEEEEVNFRRPWSSGSSTTASSSDEEDDTCSARSVIEQAAHSPLGESPPHLLFSVGRSVAVCRPDESALESIDDGRRREERPTATRERHHPHERPPDDG